MTLPSPSDDYNDKSRTIDTVYQERLRQSFAYYSDKWDDKNLSNHYQVRRQWLLNTIAEFYQSTNKHNSNLQILDVGCGNGLLLIDIGETLGYIDGIGVDLTEEMIVAAKKRTLYFKKKYEWIQMDLENDDYHAKLGKRQFDIIMMNGVVCYFKNISQVLKIIRFFLKQGSLLIIVHHDPNNLTNLFLRIQSLLEPEFIWVRNTAKKEIITYAEAAGYCLQKAQSLPCGGIPELFYNIGKIFWDGYGLVFTKK